MNCGSSAALSDDSTAGSISSTVTLLRRAIGLHEEELSGTILQAVVVLLVDPSSSDYRHSRSTLLPSTSKSAKAINVITLDLLQRF